MVGETKGNQNAESTRKEKRRFGMMTPGRLRPGLGWEGPMVRGWMEEDWKMLEDAGR